MFTERILEELKEISDKQEIKRNSEYIVGFALFTTQYFEEILEGIERALSYRSEKIICRGKGKIVDSGIKQFEIEKAFFMEYYDYPSATSVFIRVYLISDNKQWIALYIDENLITPWWSNEERESE